MRVRTSRRPRVVASAIGAIGVIAALLVAPPAVAQGTGTISGRVLTSDGIVLGEASVFLYDAAGAMVAFGAADASGSYTLAPSSEELATGRYTVQAWPEGADPAFQTRTTDNGSSGTFAEAAIDYSADAGSATVDVVVPYRVSGLRAAGVIDTTSKSAVTTAYRSRLAADLKVGSFQGLKGCRAAHTSIRVQRATADALNVYRALQGLAPVRIDPTAERSAHASSIIQAANGVLSHDPPTSARCFTTTGRDAASRSSLASGATAARAVAMYFEDPGAGNLRVGHRRNASEPTLTAIGTSDVTDFNSLYSAAFAEGAVPGPAYLPWPSANWFPTQLEPNGRWSFTSTQGQDLSAATLRVSGAQGLTARVVDRRSDGLTFQVGGLSTVRKAAKAGRSTTIRVTVSGITHFGARAQGVTYDVRLFQVPSR